MNKNQIPEPISSQLQPIIDMLHGKGYLPEDPLRESEGVKEVKDKLAALYLRADQSGTVCFARFRASALASVNNIAFPCNLMLHFSYDPATALFDIKKVECLLAGGISQVSSLVETGKELPSVREMIRRLVDRITGKQDVEEVMGEDQKQARIEEYVRSYHELLVEREYAGKDDPEMAAAMMGKLREAFAALKAHPAELGEKSLLFKVETSLVPSGDKLDFLFHFDYDPQKVSVDLKAVMLETRDMKLIYPVALKSHFPSVGEFMDTLKHLGEKKAAEQKQTRRQGKSPGI